MASKKKPVAKKSSAKKSATGKEWNVAWKDVNELTPYKNNARINDSTVPYLVNSIKRFGFKVPLVIDGKGVVVCGHTRLKAALEIGMARVPCVVATDLTEQELKAFRLADNKVQEMSSWDYEKLESEMKELEEDGFDELKDFGFALFDAGEGLGDGDLPPELAGKDLTPEELPDAGGEADTCGRIIITFDENERGALADILGVKELPKDIVSYSLEKIIQMKAENENSK